MIASHLSESVSETLKASPPVTVVGLSLAGISLEQWVLITTLAYTLLQTGWFIYSKFIRQAPQTAEGEE